MDLMNVLVTSQYLRQIGGAGSNGSGGGADWNASEGEAGYVKNRTHYIAINVVDQRSDVVTDSSTAPDTYGALSDRLFGSPGSPKMPEGKYLLFKLGDVSYKITHLPTKINSNMYRENIVLENGVTIRYSLTTKTPNGQNDRKSLYCRVHPVLTDGLAPYVGQTFSIQLVESILKPLDEIYIPNNIPKVQAATVGQTVVVKTVDENGKPTEWEASDFSSTQVQPDWLQADDSEADYIKNKPSPVDYNIEQDLTDEQKGLARANIGISGIITEDTILDLLGEVNAIAPLADDDGALLADGDEILLL